jgi:putative membrane protein
MIIFFILGLLLGGVAVIFALQNIGMVSIVFLGWQLEGSLAVVLSLSVLLGIVIALLLTLPELMSNYFQNRSLLNRNRELEEDLRKQKELTHFAKTNPPTPEAITHIEQGAIHQ